MYTLPKVTYQLHPPQHGVKRVSIEPYTQLIETFLIRMYDVDGHELGVGGDYCYQFTQEILIGSRLRYRPISPSHDELMMGIFKNYVKKHIPMPPEEQEYLDFNRTDKEIQDFLLDLEQRFNDDFDQVIHRATDNKTWKLYSPSVESFDFRITDEKLFSAVENYLYPFGLRLRSHYETCEVLVDTRPQPSHKDTKVGRAVNRYWDEYAKSHNG